MSMKKTDLEKLTAKKLDGRMKSGPSAARFGQGTTQKTQSPAPRPSKPAPKLVQVSCRLPSDLVAQLQVRAASTEGGMGGVLSLAAQQWLSSQA